jgi:hypothetical protein
MLINCSHCSARVDGKLHQAIPTYERDDTSPQFINGGYRVSLLQCPSCQNPLIAWQEYLYDDPSNFGDSTVWSDAKRVWPMPESSFDPSIPKGVQISLNEARTCLVCGSYTASVVMSGRALETVARHFHVVGKAERLMLASGLRELHDSGKIDQRLYDWGKELHEHRNLAAHASERTFSREDAEDLFEFVSAICEYLFVLQDRYERFMERKTHLKAGAFNGQ